jgi:hypothetical protein
MSSMLTNYLWYESYVKAICETDETRKPGRILEARSALEQRLLSPVRPGSDEDRAIKNAQRVLMMLTTKRAVCVNDRIEDRPGVPV